MTRVADEEISFSPLEVGLLTVIDRRGAVRTAHRLDLHNDPAAIERLVVLRRLVERGLLIESAPDGDEAVEVEFVMTEAGRAALAATDAAPEA